jgi:carnitine 3-dehydrogenase
MAHPERFVVGHPFNPVYLLPLVEICCGDKTTAEVKAQADVFYTAIGMRPLQVRKEIDGFIADRLLEAVWREALWLVNDGVATTAEIDDAIRYGAGLRWSFMGTFLIYRMAGGEAGMRHFLSQFGPALKLPWTKLVAPELTDELTDLIAAQSDDQAEGVSIRDLERKRDECLISVLSALRHADYGAGETLKLYGDSLAAAGPSAAPKAVDETQPLELYKAKVPTDWIDYNGHMTESRYLQVFGDATDAVLAYAGAGPAYVAAGRSYFTVETHIRHLDECREGEALAVTTQILGADAKRLHLFHSLYQPDRGALLATAEHMLVHVDAEARRSVPAEGPVMVAIARLAKAQAGLAAPDAAGRAIAMPASKTTAGAPATT